MDSEKSKTFGPHRLIFNLKIKREVINIFPYQILACSIHE